MTKSVVFRQFLSWGPDATGPTRAAGLLRIGLATIALTRFSAELAPFAASTAKDLLIGLIFFFVAIAALVGWNSRLSIGLLGALIITLYALTQAGVGTAGWNHHHVYILGVSCVFLSLTDCGRSYSYERWRMLQDESRLEPEIGALWGQRIIALQMSALYFWTAVDKTDAAFLSGQRLEQIFVWSYSGRMLEFFLTWPILLAAFSIAVVVVEYFLAIAILVKRWLKIAVPLGLTLHAAFYLLLPVETYSVTMMLLYLALLDPKAVWRFTERMQSS